MSAQARTPLISIIVPVYNEAGNLPFLYKELAMHSARLPYNFELLFVDDGSRDESAKVLHKVARNDRRVRLIRFSRNFGKEAAVTAGLHAARGSAALIMDADLQMPPKLMGQFLHKWESGAEVVVGVFKSRNMSRIKRWGAGLFYKIMRRISPPKLRQMLPTTACSTAKLSTCLINLPSATVSRVGLLTGWDLIVSIFTSSKRHANLVIQPTQLVSFSPLR